MKRVPVQTDFGYGFRRFTTATPLCVAFGTNYIEQFPRYIEKDVNINGAVECLDGASDFLSGAFNSRTRDPIFKRLSKACVISVFCVSFATVLLWKTLRLVFEPQKNTSPLSMFSSRFNWFVYVRFSDTHYRSFPFRVRSLRICAIAQRGRTVPDMLDKDVQKVDNSMLKLETLEFP